MEVYDQYSRDELEDQYNLRKARPDYESSLMPEWSRRSKETFSRLQGMRDLRYGSGPRQKLDIFPVSPEASTLVFFHGGYWQRGHKDIYGFLAAPFVQAGNSFVVVGYDLCPQVTISEVCDQAREALAWIWRNGESHGISIDRITVMGHSAGGHIAAMLLGTNWPELGGLPRDLLKGGVLISPVTMLTPLIDTSLNDTLHLDPVEAERVSPINNPPCTDAPQLVVWGELESDEFKRQADTYARKFQTPARRIERYVVPDADHFDEIEVLSESRSVLFSKILKLTESD